MLTQAREKWARPPISRSAPHTLNLPKPYKYPISLRLQLELGSGLGALGVHAAARGLVLLSDKEGFRVYRGTARYGAEEGLSFEV